MNSEGRNHHHRNHGEVQQHDGGLAPGVLPEAPLASEASTKQKTYPHGDFEDENYIDGARSGRFEECLYQQIISTQTNRLRSVRVQLRVSRGRVSRIHPGNREEVLMLHIGVAHEQIL